MSRLYPRHLCPLCGRRTIVVDDVRLCTTCDWSERVDRRVRREARYFSRDERAWVSRALEGEVRGHIVC